MDACVIEIYELQSVRIIIILHCEGHFSKLTLVNVYCEFKRDIILGIVSTGNKLRYWCA